MVALVMFRLLRFGGAVGWGEGGGGGNGDEHRQDRIGNHFIIQLSFQSSVFQTSLQVLLCLSFVGFHFQRFFKFPFPKFI